MPKTIVLIHGAWLTPLAWEKFRARYEAKGFEVIAPPWPYEDVPLSELRRAPDPRIGRLTVRAIVDHYDAIIRALPESPIIMGHSFGGLFTQLLLDRRLGAVGIAITPGAPAGIAPAPRTLLSALPVFTAWNGWNRVLTMSYSSFARGFAQNLPEADKRAAFERYIAPTPGRIYYDGALGVGTAIVPNNPKRAPLLIVAGEEDRIVAPSMVRANYLKEQRNPSMTAFKSFPGRSHFLFAEPGWEEVADYVLDWAVAHARSPRGAAAQLKAQAVEGHGTPAAPVSA